MNKLKSIAATAGVLLVLAAVIAGYIASQDWTIRYKSELDDFFGEDNWECISEETKESMIYTEYVRVHSNPARSREVAGKYKNWYIKFTNKHGEEEIWYITNHVLKINHDKYGILSSKRYSGRQALTLELMDISFGIIGEDIHDEIVKSLLPEEEAACIEVFMSYTGGNPKPEFYDALSKEDWFTADEVSAEHYLVYELHDFHIYIRTYDYRLEALTQEQRDNIFGSLEKMEQKLLEAYGEHASFEIYLDSEHKSEYADGRKVTEE